MRRWRPVWLGESTRGTARRAAVLICVLGLVAWPIGSARAESGEWNVHLEPGVGMLVGRPQSELWAIGGGGAAKLEWALGDRIGLQVEASGLVFRDDRSPDPSLHQRDPGAGGMLLLGAGVRVRPFDDRGGYALHLGDGPNHRGNLFGNVWIDADVGWVRTGTRNRIGFDAAVGLELSLMDGVQVGPFAKYVQIVESSSQLQPEDARIALGGVSVSFGGGQVHLPDTDGDGLADPEDRCPTEPEDPDGFEDSDGCPEPDNDGDGIPDARDRCPDVPEDLDGQDDRDGCPEPDRVAPAPQPVPAPTVDVRDEPTDILLEQRVLFETARAVVRVHYFDFVQQVRALMEEHSEYLRIRVEGHADERGTDAYNDWLSTERARRAASWLERFGVDASRIEIVGYGRRNPAVPGRTMHALRQNRRVNFRVIMVRRTVEVPAPAPPPPPDVAAPLDVAAPPDSAEVP
jgi:outer membrane protein OmpA-like peptidoglycan-associated protein